MAKVRIHEIAKELGSSSKKILEKAKELGFAVTTGSSAVSQEDAEKLYISAHSSKESQAAYRALGCVHAEEINAKLAQEEPCDVQMEYRL